MSHALQLLAQRPRFIRSVMILSVGTKAGGKGNGTIVASSPCPAPFHVRKGEAGKPWAARRKIAQCSNPDKAVAMKGQQIF
jgi:hypothetical protein